jgi:prolyl-tRNA synthetase
VVDSLTNYYAATDEERDPEIEASLGDDLVVRRGIEVGHIFYFGTKYSKPMGAKVTGPDGEDVLIEMGSYGIGVSRLVGAIIEAYHDDDGIIWPDAVAPFAACEDFYAKLSKAGLEPIYDDRDERAGAKFADMDLIGIPRQLVVGPRSLKNGMIELKSRGGGELEELSPDEALNRLTAGQAEG